MIIVSRLIVIVGVAWMLGGGHPAVVAAHSSQEKSGFALVNGARLFYEMKGPAATNGTIEETPVLLVHGLSLDRRMWDRQFDALAKHFVTYRLDLRGHGQSDAVTGPVGLHDDLVGFMDALGIDRAHLVGQSLGGNAVTEVAASHSVRVESLILVDSGINGFAYPTPNVLQRVPAYLQIFNTEGQAAALRAWIQDRLFAVSLERRRVREALARIILGCPCSLFFNPQFQIRPPTFTRLSQIVAPTLVLIGEFDTHEFQAAADALHQGIAGSRKIVIPDAGHMANMDEPVAVTREILRFLRRTAQAK
jgi:pimeloyl-ACP methyl ester carboxylesterase